MNRYTLWHCCNVYVVRQVTNVMHSLQWLTYTTLDKLYEMQPCTSIDNLYTLCTQYAAM